MLGREEECLTCPFRTNRSGFESPGLDRPGRLPHQQGLLGMRGEAGLPRRVTPIGGPGTRVTPRALHKTSAGS
jgi:hypothetical protein